MLSRNLSLPPHIFQAGGFVIDPTSSAPMTTVDIIDEGVDTTGAVKVFAQHTCANSFFCFQLSYRSFKLGTDINIRRVIPYATPLPHSQI